MKFIIIIIISILINVSLASNINKSQCEALIISSGSDYGAFSAGAIGKFLETNNIEYDVYAGTGISSITAAILNSFQEQQRTQIGSFLEQFWSDLRLDNFSTTFDGGMGYGLVYQPGMFSTEPLQKYLQIKLKSGQYKKLSYGVVNIDNGEFIDLNENSFQSQEQFIQSLVAASAVPGYFPWQNIQETNVFDGGVRRVLNLQGALERCREVVKHEEDMIFDIISIFSIDGMDPWGGFKPKQKTYQAFRRNEIIKAHKKAMHEISQFFENHPKIQCRYYVEPSVFLPEPNSLFGFKKQQVAAQVQNGQLTASKSIENGVGVECSKLQQKAFIYSLRSSDEEFQDLSDEQIINLMHELKQE